MRAFRSRGPWLLLVGVAGSQAGHLLVYWLRLRAAAGAAQSSGAHAYFPSFAGTVLSLAGAALIVALGLIGTARALDAGRAGRRIVRPSLIDVLAALYTLQLACFAFQEWVEALHAGAPMAPGLLIAGVACQLPVAFGGALAIVLFLGRLEAAIDTLASVHGQPWPGVTARAAHVVVAADVWSLTPQTPGGRPSGRGPPTPLP